MPYAFIGGVPMAGKSHLAKLIAEKYGIMHIQTDDIRKNFKDPKLVKWVRSFYNQNPDTYWQKITHKQHYEQVKKQSEELWPAIVKEINNYKKKYKTIIFEGRTILPCLASSNLNFPGVYLIAKSFKQILERNNERPRWVKDKEFQYKLAECLYFYENKKLVEEAKKYGFKSFKNPNQAEKELIKILNL